jgi:putative ABC transport system permease protein
MLRNYLASALRNLVRNRFYAFISVACLSVGLAAAFFAAAYVDHLRSYNRWIAGYEQVYRIGMEYTLPGSVSTPLDTTPQDVAAWLELNVEHAAAVTRILTTRSAVKRADFEAFETVAWADRAMFDVLPFPVLRGDPATALQQPDSVVLSRSLARKYFGTDQALGRTLEIDRRGPMVVRAIIEDLPPNTRLFDQGDDIGVFAASTAAFSPTNSNSVPWTALNYVRFDAGMSRDQLDQQLAGYRREGSSVKVRLQGRPLDEIVYSRDRHAALQAMPWLAGLVLLISCMNFVNLTTARSVQRGTEVGVRKAAGAGRWDLIGQFMGEALIYSTIGMVAALSLCELSLPIVRTLLDAPLPFEYWHSGPLMAAIVGITLATALLSGLYPAVLLARLNPAAILNGGKSKTGQTVGLRHALVCFQFAVLAALVAAVTVAQSQLDHLLQNTLRFDGERMLIIHSSCRRAFIDELRKLPGVTDVACSESAPINLSFSNMVAKLADGTRHAFEAVRIDAGFLELYGLRPLAGRFFRADAPLDVVAEPEQPVQRIVISATAVRNFGFDSPQAAIGRQPFPGERISFEIIGVVDDFRLGRFDEPMHSTIYLAAPARGQLLSVKLRGDRIPETLDRIDQLWKQAGDPKPIRRTFLSETIETMHRAIVRQRWIFGAFAVLAVSLAIIGMLGLASSAAEEKRLEVGVRKAFGAGVPDIVRLVLWRFIKLATLAGVIGCAVAVPLMDRWLQGFQDRIDLQPYVFVSTCALIVCVAVLTVAIHAVLMARARPGAALR